MRNIWQYLKAYFFGPPTRSQQTAAALRELEYKEADLTAAKAKDDKRYEQLQRAVAEARRLIAKLENEVAERDAKLRIYEEITVPGLTAAHQLLLQHYEADTAVQTRRAVAALPAVD